jgi:hypothetical protein
MSAGVRNHVRMAAVLAVALTAIVGGPARTRAEARPIVGAIRWDAWYGQGGPVAEVERSLGPRKFHFRLPFFARVLADDKVSINGDSPGVIEKEIAWAADAGLNYWAFVDYGDEGDLTIARRRYQAAQKTRFFSVSKSSPMLIFRYLMAIVRLESGCRGSMQDSRTEIARLLQQYGVSRTVTFTDRLSDVSFSLTALSVTVCTPIR